MDSFKTLVKNLYQKYIRPNAKYLWSLAIAILAFVLAHYFYFKENPLFTIQYLGETLILALVFLLLFFFGLTTLRMVGAGLQNFFVGVLYEAYTRAYTEFWKVQTARLVEAIKKDEPHLSLVKVDYPRDSVVLDTSTIIDGRILGAIETGFLDNPIIVPQNVVDELQHMADKSNDMKRQKGRRGLDTLKDIRKAAGKNNFKIVDFKSSTDPVDKTLVEFCRVHKCKLATVDFNLNKVGQVAGIKILNINSLANEIKTNLLPGESLLVKLVQSGKEENQAVGFLEDGTMIVIKNASEYIGESKEVTVEKVLQTSAGRMVFATINS
jgi:uncharacterized protein YacL